MWSTAVAHSSTCLTPGLLTLCQAIYENHVCHGNGNGIIYISTVPCVLITRDVAFQTEFLTDYSVGIHFTNAQINERNCRCANKFRRAANGTKKNVSNRKRMHANAKPIFACTTNANCPMAGHVALHLMHCITHRAHSGLVSFSETCNQCVSYFFYFYILYLFSHRTRCCTSRSLATFFSILLCSHFARFFFPFHCWVFLPHHLFQHGFSSHTMIFYCWWIPFTIFA